MAFRVRPRGYHPAMSGPLPPVSVIVPAYREVGNLESLADRVFTALREGGVNGEMVIVDDDSRDGTEDLARRLGERFAVRLVIREGVRGLSSAVMTGFEHARHEVFVVLDADLQHPPELIPELLALLAREGCDFVIGTRYGLGARIDENWPVHRCWMSRLATAIARPLAPLSDPMSGYFALRRETWLRGTDLDPVGYKIALELYVKCGCRRPAEIPICFAPRHAGESKMSAKVQLQYLRHLWSLYCFRFPFLAAGGMVVALGAGAAFGWWLVDRVWR